MNVFLNLNIFYFILPILKQKEGKVNLLYLVLIFDLSTYKDHIIHKNPC